jgi:transporter family-2 protein
MTSTMANLLLLPISVLAGAAGACQASANAALAARAGLGPALLVNSSIVLFGTVVLFFASGGLRTLPAVSGAPWFDFVGGVCGFAIIASMTFAFPRMGAAVALALMVLGQSAMAMVIDHYGLWGMPTVAATPTRLAGAVLLVAGVILLRR